MNKITIDNRYQYVGISLGYEILFHINGIDYLGKVCKYQGYYLSINKAINDVIFNVLEINKYNIISEIENYIPDESIWPETKNINSLWILINKIYDIIEEKGEKPMEVKKKLRKKHAKMDIRSILDLNIKGLHSGDIIHFEFNQNSLRYEVHDNYLNDLDNDNNDEIFDLLNIEDPYGFAETHYGYEPEEDNAGWPEFEFHDFESLTELVEALYDKLEKGEKPSKLTSWADIERWGFKHGDECVIIYKDDEIELDITNNLIRVDTRDGDGYFGVLNLIEYSEEEFHELAEKAFGYPTKSQLGNGEPEHKYKDYEAGLRLVKLLYEELTGEYSPNININKFKNGKGKTVELQRITPSIRKGEKRRGRSISGRTGPITVKSGHLRNREISRR